MELVAVIAAGGVILALFVALLLAERRVERYGQECLRLLAQLSELRDTHARERTDWAAAAAEERRRLLDEASAERAGLINATLAATQNVGAQVAAPWPDGVPVELPGAEELTERARQIDAELAARDSAADGVGL